MDCLAPEWLLLVVEQYVTRALAMAGSVYVLTRGAVTWHGAPGDITEEESCGATCLSNS